MLPRRGRRRSWVTLWLLLGVGARRITIPTAWRTLLIRHVRRRKLQSQILAKMMSQHKGVDSMPRLPQGSRMQRSKLLVLCYTTACGVVLGDGPRTACTTDVLRTPPPTTIRSSSAAGWLQRTAARLQPLLCQRVHPLLVKRTSLSHHSRSSVLPVRPGGSIDHTILRTLQESAQSR